MKPLQIMVAEDESITAIDLQYTLKSLGYAVPAVVSSGEEAIARAAEIQPNLILMDKHEDIGGASDLWLQPPPSPRRLTDSETADSICFQEIL